MFDLLLVKVGKLLYCSNLVLLGAADGFRPPEDSSEMEADLPAMTYSYLS